MKVNKIRYIQREKNKSSLFFFVIFTYMTKLELFQYLQNLEDKSGGYKKADSIKKHYPEIYEGIMNTCFPSNFTFVQKLWHFLRDDFTTHTCKCGNPVKFIDFRHGYRQFCSDRHCEHVLEYNKSTLHKAQVESRKPSSRKKAVETTIEKNGGTFWTDEGIQKLRENYVNNRENLSKKIRETIKSNINTAKEVFNKNVKGCVSYNEIEFYKYLIDFFGDENIIPQYMDKAVYPYMCDFYIVPLDLYIEIQGTWTHGNHPFDPNDENDLKQLEEWKNKDNDYYNQAIYTWTDLDVRKRKIAQENNLNIVEIFSHTLDDCINELDEYLITQIINYCLSQPFPGTSKWVAEHPIWNCNVGNRPSPMEAWSDETCITKAVRNVFNISHREDKVRRTFVREMMTCKVHNNQILKSSQRFLELILNRFTIAKIASKVTAISEKTVYDIIEESGIDISNGVYVPMSGFGGIVRGSKQWGYDNNIDVECECYDINPNLCAWYGWTEKDMLQDTVVTDKVCICCPPFGKDYEHWKGTPRDMSNIPFKEWYRLIKKHVIAPHYIIIGPEIGGKNKKTGLFTKSTGVMVWTDEMIEKGK